MKKSLLFKILLIGSLLPLYAAIKPDVLFQDHMVIQRGKKIPVWGKANANESIKVQFMGQTVSGKADGKGDWTLELKPTTQHGGPHQMTISGSNKIVIKDIYIGDVWIVSGQSNIVRKGAVQDKEGHAKLNTPLIRAFQGASVEVKGWEICNKTSVADKISTAAYYFGKTIHENQNIPIGLIVRSEGGTTIQKWMGGPGLGQDPALKKLYEGKRAPDLMTKDGGELYHANIKPLIKFPIKGVFWWQGESNNGKPLYYHDALPLLIKYWRRAWNQNDMPFVSIIVPTGGGLRAKPLGDPSGKNKVWKAHTELKPLPAKPNNYVNDSEMRDAYLKSLAIPNVEVVNNLDFNGSLHPNGLDLYGIQTAKVALQSFYKAPVKGIGPRLSKATVSGNKLKLEFSHTGKGLISYLGPAQGIDIKGANGKRAWGNLDVNGNTITVSHPSISKPVEARYAWACFIRFWNKRDTCTVDAKFANLFSSDSLPMEPFRWSTEQPVAISPSEGTPYSNSFTAEQLESSPWNKLYIWKPSNSGTKPSVKVNGQLQ